MDEKEWYMEWLNSPFYHKLYFEKEDNQVTGFIEKIGHHLQLHKDKRIVELGCGRGKYSKMLAGPGCDVTGIDLAPAAIEYAQQFETENLHFAVHDIRLPFWGNYFDHAINLFTSFGFYHTRREHEAAIRTIARSIKPNGTLLIDFLNVHYAEEHQLPGITKNVNGTVYDIEKWDDDTHFYKKIKITDPSITDHLEYTEKITKFSLGDFNDMLSFHGVQVEEVFGDYELNSYDVRKTPRLILIARKTHEDAADKEKRLYSDGRAGDALT